MQFTFSEDQTMFRDSVRGMLEKECDAEAVRALWDTDTGRSEARWAKLAEIGLLGVLVPEEHGGLAMNELDLVLPLEETGRVALPEPVVETAALAAPLLAESGNAELCARWLPAIAAGEAIVTIAPALNPVVTDAHVADLLIAERDGRIVAAERGAFTFEAQPSNDLSRRLFTVELSAADATEIAAGDEAERLMTRTLDRAALAIAAQQLGITEQLLHLSVEYAKDRHQFGKPIGSFQAIKHMLANVAVKLEFARPLVYHAAHSLAADADSRSVDVSQAKAAADDAAWLGAKTGLQVHGGIGYTWEVDLHLWMKRAWALEASWGNRLWHRRRVADAILGSAPAPSFGFSGRAA